MMKHHLFIYDVNDASAWGGCEWQMIDYFRRVDFSKQKITIAITHDVFSKREDFKFRLRSHFSLSPERPAAFNWRVGQVL